MHPNSRKFDQHRQSMGVEAWEEGVAKETEQTFENEGCVHLSVPMIAQVHTGQNSSCDVI